MKKIYFYLVLLLTCSSIVLLTQNSFAQDTVKVKNGFQKFYYKSGILSSEGMMRDGKPDGYWKSYYENGKIKSEGNRKNYELDSIWKFYKENGRLILDAEYRNGKKNGVKTTYLEKETIRENYRNDVKEGYARYYYPDGKLKMEVPFQNGLEWGFGKEYDPDGTIITLTEYKRGFVVDRMRINRKDKDNLKQGKWYTFYPNGNIHVEGTYKDDQKDGYFKEYAENGDLLSVEKYINGKKQLEAQEVKKLDLKNEYYPDGKIKSSGTFRNGLPEGIFREYNPTGQVIKSLVYSEGTVTGEGIIEDDGVRNGHWKDYYADGKLKAEGEYKDGKPAGEWKFFYDDGKLEQTGKYTNNGKYQGTWRWYFENEQLKREEEYTNGELDGMHTEYDENGRKVEEGEYADGQEEGPWFTTIGDYFERGIYKDGLKNGKWVTYNLVSSNSKTDSIKLFSGSFVEDNPDGKHIYYWDNGKIKDEGMFIMGRKDGEWIKYEYDGTPFLVITYRNGVEIKYNGTKIKPPFDAPEQ